MRSLARLVRNRFGGTLQILYEKKELRQDCSLHCHDFTELELILDGDGETELNGSTYPVGRGTVCLLTPSDFHAYTIQKPLAMINVQFAADRLRGLELPHAENPICRADEKKLQRLCAILEQLETLRSEKEEEKLCAERLLEAALALLLSQFRAGERPLPPSDPIGKALAYVHAHFKENPSLDAISEAVYLDKRYFCTLFRRHVGKSYKTYLREIKLNYAARLLRCTALPVTEIAAESGYSSISHFNREFHAFHGVSPSELRRQGQA